MLRGLYAANTALVTQQMVETVVGNNLANLNTWGYKADAAALRSFREVLLWRLEGYGQSPVGTVGPGVAVDEVRTDFETGPLVFTGRRLDLALAGPGYFVLQDAAGEVYLTRCGALAVNAQGYLVTEHGHLVLGEGGPISVGAEEVSVGEDRVVRVAGEAVGRLLVVDVQGQAPEKVEAGLLRPPDRANLVALETPVKSGHLEQSNVDAVRAMVELLSAFRAYEAAQRVLRAQDETLGRSIEVGSLR